MASLLVLPLWAAAAVALLVPMMRSVQLVNGSGGGSRLSAALTAPIFPFPRPRLLLAFPADIHQQLFMVALLPRHDDGLTPLTRVVAGRRLTKSNDGEIPGTFCSRGIWALLFPVNPVTSKFCNAGAVAASMRAVCRHSWFTVKCCHYTWHVLLAQRKRPQW